METRRLGREGGVKWVDNGGSNNICAGLVLFSENLPISMRTTSKSA